MTREGPAALTIWNLGSGFREQFGGRGGGGLAIEGGKNLPQIGVSKKYSSPFSKALNLGFSVWPGADGCPKNKLPLLVVAMKKLFLTAAAASSLLPAARAQINHFDISDESMPFNGSPVFLDLDGGTASRGFQTGVSDIKIYFNDAEYPAAYTFVDEWRIGATGSRIARYTLGQPESLTFSTTRSGGYLEYDGTGPWANDSGAQTAYLGLRNTNDGREAWIGIKYNDASNTILVESFAVAPGAVDMKAGQTVVPEPEATAAVMALLAGGAAVFHRRQKKRANTSFAK